jgi:hypothetical protein
MPGGISPFFILSITYLAIFPASALVLKPLLPTNPSAPG